MDDWNEAESHAYRAQAFLEVGDWNRAVRELRLALAANPDQSDWLFGMGIALDALKRHEEAVRCFEQVLRVEGEDLEIMLHLSAALIRAKRPRDALRVLQRVSRIEPDCEPAYCYRIKAHALLDEHEQAEEMFYLARLVTDECPHCYDHIGESLARQGKLDRAIWCWQQVVRLDPLHDDVHAKLAVAHWRQGKLQRAREYFLRQLDLDPEDLDSLMAMAQLLIEMQLTDEAADVLRELLQIEPEHAHAHLLLAELALQRAQLNEAEEHLQKARKFEPRLAGVHLRQAQLARRRGDLESARRHLRMETRRNDHSPSLCLELSRELLELDLPAPANALLTHLLLDIRTPLDANQRATAYLYRGVAYMLNDQHDRAFRDCRRATQLDPNNPLAAHNAVAAALLARQPRRARALLRALRRNCPYSDHLRLLQHRLRLRPLLAWLRPDRPVVKPVPWAANSG